MSTFADLKASLEIDKSCLDDEVIRQPVLFYAISEQVTDAIAERDAAKEELALVDATLDAKYRSNMGRDSSKRVTETFIQNCVCSDNNHQKSLSIWLRAKLKADRLLALKEAFQQRSYMLRDLVSLYSANYYEVESLKPSKVQDMAHFHANRARLANARLVRKA